MAPPVPPLQRVVAVTVDLGSGSYRYGSGCLVGGSWVLTTAHVVVDAVAVTVSTPEKREYRARTDQRFVGDVDGPAPDLALVEITDVTFEPLLEPIAIAAVNRDSATAESVERVHAIGFPEFADREISGVIRRETVDAIGVLPTGSGLAGGLLSLVVSISPEPLPPAEIALGNSQWSGISGAPVLANGQLLGVVSEHAPRAGPSVITAVPMSALEEDPAHPDWGTGVSDPGAWFSRLAAGASADWPQLPVPLPPRPEPAYLDTLREFGRTLHSRMPQLLAREVEIAHIGAFATSDAGYRWLIGGAYTGKSALLFEAVTVGLPDNVDTVSYFLSRRASDASSERFLAAIVPQLAYLCDLDSPTATKDEYFRLWRIAAERAERVGRHLLLAVDGLDEDLLPSGAPSVASLLPTLAGGTAHVLVTSRPHPTMARDIPTPHPLREVEPALLTPFAGAEGLADLARQEIDDLIVGGHSDLAVEVLGALTAASGPLALSDLATLSNDLAEPSTTHTRHVRRLINENAARSLEPVGPADDPRYQFTHLSLLEYAQTNHDLSDPGYKRRLREWAEGWRAAGWPSTGEGATPRYLLDAYPQTLHQDPEQLARLVRDPIWVCSAVRAVSVETVLAELRTAVFASPDDPSLAAMLILVRGQAQHLREADSNNDPDYVVRQLCHQAVQLGEQALAARLRKRLLASSSAIAVPDWSTRRPDPPLIAQFTSHDGGVRALAALADGRLVTGGEDGRVRVRDPFTSGINAVDLGGGHVGRVHWVVVLPNGSVVTGGDDEQIWLWDATVSHAESIAVGSQFGWIHAIAALPDGRLASGWNDGRLQISGLVPSPNDQVKRGAHFGAVRALATLSDGTVASGGDDGSIRLWHPAEFLKNQVTLGAHIGSVRALCVLPDGRIVSGGDDGWVRLWNPSGTSRGGVDLGSHHGRVLAVAVLTTGKVVSSGDDGRIRLWDPIDPQGGPIDLGRQSRGVLALSVLPAGWVATGGADGVVRIWDPDVSRDRDDASGRAGKGGGDVGTVDATMPVHWGRSGNWTGERNPAAAAARARRGTVQGQDGTVNRGDIQDLEAFELTRSGSRITALTVLPDGRIITGSEGGRVCSWASTAARDGGIDLGNHFGPVRALSVLPDGRILSGAEDEPIQVCDPDSPESGPVYLGHHDGRLATLLALADGRVLSGGASGLVRMCDSGVPGSPWVEVGGDQFGAVLTLAVLPDGRVVSGSADGRLRLWDPGYVSKGWSVLGGHKGAVLAVATLSDGRIVSGGADRHIRIWDPATPQTPLHEDGSWSGPVVGVTALPEGYVAAGSPDGVRIWHADRTGATAILACPVDTLSAATHPSLTATLAVAHPGNGISTWLLPRRESTN